ncbi:hypothetical protein [Agromyces sp. S2-1-8]|uniref:hypothetical protein n=1 Tax=unclassified Agromyces TaxID=2639701 RepID=UPI001E3CBD91|nr:hypothetical protein [Agromyces sp. S2-1-8]MCD5346711.1 hypothetical protein [Agromyces sp. S2-1-8]
MSEAATRCDWRCADADAAARLRVSAALATLEDRVAPVDRAAALRAELAEADAAREAPLRFDPDASAVVLEGDSPSAAAAAAAAAAALLALRVAAAFFAAAERAAERSAGVIAAVFDVAEAGFAPPSFEPAGFAAAPFSEPAFEPADEPALVERAPEPPVDPVGAPPCSDAPAPVPSTASSSWSERETEVTKPTYQ